jgi:hypothetical protein
VENTKTYLTGGREGGNFKHLWLGFNKIYRASLKQKGGRAMVSIFRRFIMIMLFVIAFMGVLQSPALGIQINAIDDAGQYAGQDAYLKFVYSSGELPITAGMVSDRWTSAEEVKTFASNNGVLKDTGWHLESAGNIWSSDNDFIVGDTFTALQAGVYRISAVDGAFTYDSFNWSDVAGKWLWQLQIYAVGGDNYTLGSDVLYDTAALALKANLGKYMDITLAEGRELIFWIADGNLGGTLEDALHRNSIDNSGSLTFNVVPIPEPSTFILAGTGLLFLSRYFRKLVRSH